MQNIIDTIRTYECWPLLEPICLKVQRDMMPERFELRKHTNERHTIIKTTEPTYPQETEIHGLSGPKLETNLTY